MLCQRPDTARVASTGLLSGGTARPLAASLRRPHKEPAGLPPPPGRSPQDKHPTRPARCWGVDVPPPRPASVSKKEEPPWGPSALHSRPSQGTVRKPSDLPFLLACLGISPPAAQESLLLNPHHVHNLLLIRDGHGGPVCTVAPRVCTAQTPHSPPARRHRLWESRNNRKTSLSPFLSPLLPPSSTLHLPPVPVKVSKRVLLLTLSLTRYSRPCFSPVQKGFRIIW